MKTALPLRAALLLFTLSFIAACKDDKDGPCGLPENTIVRTVESENLNTRFIQYTGTLTDNGDDVVFYSYSGSRVTFFSGMNVPCICTENHFHPSFKVRTWAPAVTESAKIYFEAYWHVLLPGENYTAINDSLEGNHNYTGTLECGLKQAFQDNPANVDLFANVEFESQGSFTADSSTFTFIINYLEISCTYDQDI